MPVLNAERANALVKLGLLDEAESAFESICEGVPDSPEGFVGLATVASRRRDWELARQRWTTCLERFPSRIQPRWRTNLAQALLKLDRLDEAEVLHQFLCKERPDDPVGFAGIASVASQRGAWATAATRWADCIARFPDRVEPSWRNSLGRAMMKVGQWDEACAVYDLLSRERPDLHWGRLGLAHVATSRSQWAVGAQQWKECRTAFESAAQPWWYSAEAEALNRLSRFGDARDVLQRLCARWPDSPLGLEGLTRTALLASEPETALALATTLIAQHPDRPVGYRRAEDALISLGRFDEAGRVRLSGPAPAPLPASVSPRPDNVPFDLMLPPIRGAGNDYSFIEAMLDDFVESRTPYHLPVTVVIPAFNRAEILSKTLAALVHQTYPLDLIEIVIADDGSHEPLQPIATRYARYFKTVYVRQEDLGYRLSAVRNLGIRAASTRHVLFLDADVLPVPGLVEAYMKYFHVTEQAVLIGLRRYVCTDDLTDEQILGDIQLALDLPDINPNNEVADWRTAEGRSVDWRLPLLAKTNELKTHRYPFMAMAGGNMAVAKSVLEQVGLFDEEFQAWGGEEQELGFRLYNAGCYFVPVRAAMGLHQEPPGGLNETERKAGALTTGGLMRRKCPTSRTGAATQDDSDGLMIPKVSIYVPVFNGERFIKSAVDSALAQTFADLEVVICNDGSTDGTLTILEEHYGTHPRVRWVSQPNRGIAAASNTAVRLCRGMYIAQLDGDDVLAPGAVEQAVALLDRSDAGVVHGGAEMIDEAGAFRRPLTALPFSRERQLVSQMVMPFRMFRKRDWMRTEGFDETLSSAVDFDMFQKLSEVCTFAPLTGLTYGYRLHGANTSLAGRKSQEANHLEVVRKALRRLKLDDQWEAVPVPHGTLRDITIERRSASA